MARTDYYSVLGVERNASAEEIRKAYRSLAREYHPDVNKSADAATRFAEVTEAYEVLSDAEKRKAYDRFGHAGVGVGQGPSHAGGWTAADFGDAGDFASVFQDLFGRGPAAPGGFGQRWRAPPPAPPRRGESVRHAITVSFMTGCLGGTEQIRLTTSSGGTQTIDVKIPPGIASGTQLRVRGQGATGEAGGPPGDLLLTVTVGRHPYFRRDGLDVLLDLPVTIAEAVFGTTVTVPLLKDRVELKVPAGTSSGQKLRVKGKGITDPKGRRGDFLAVVQIVCPENIDDAGRAALKELADKLPDPRASAPWADGVRDS
ncbi:MAG: DnaJ C-terminal domain-containing protein [Planctomycetota bacterium]|jgi:DnaJ-class molecular chaperone